MRIFKQLLKTWKRQAAKTSREIAEDTKRSKTYIDYVFSGATVPVNTAFLRPFANSIDIDYSVLVQAILEVKTRKLEAKLMKSEE